VARLSRKSRAKQAWFIGRAPASLARRFVAIVFDLSLSCLKPKT
jgi:hypothetical protein